MCLYNNGAKQTCLVPRPVLSTWLEELMNGVTNPLGLRQTIALQIKTRRLFVTQALLSLNKMPCDNKDNCFSEYVGGAFGGSS